MATRAVVLTNSSDGTVSVKINTGNKPPTGAQDGKPNPRRSVVTSSADGSVSVKINAKGAEGGAPETRLFVGGLTIKNADIKPLFSGFGRVIHCDTDFDGFAFVSFARRDDAIRAMEKLSGRKTNAGQLKISESTGKGYDAAVRRRDMTTAKDSTPRGKSEPRKKNSPGATMEQSAPQTRGSKPKNGSRLHVSGLKKGIKPAEVKRMFSGYGKVVEVNCDFEGACYPSAAAMPPHGQYVAGDGLRQLATRCACT